MIAAAKAAAAEAGVALSSRQQGILQEQIVANASIFGRLIG